MDTASKIQQFQQETGASAKDAKTMLAGTHWDVQLAISSYKFLKCSARPPSGPQKNQEIPQTNSQMDLTKSLAQGVMAGSGTATEGVNSGRGTALPSEEPAEMVEVKRRNAHIDKPPPSPNNQNRRLLRGLSKTSENIQLVNKARDIVLGDIVEDKDAHSNQTPSHMQHFVDTPEYTFILPDLTKYPADFRAFLHKDLIETSTLVSLEQAGRLNWWADIGACQRLLPLATTGDGNCLLHAASLGMWGFHDRLLTLRKALHKTLSSAEAHGALWRRWRWHQTLVNKQSGLIYDEKEWQSEWKSLLRLASSEPRTAPGRRPSSCCDSLATKGSVRIASFPGIMPPSNMLFGLPRLMERQNRESDGEEVFYESLEELHVFVLAHVLRRPIIVVADTILKDSNGEALAPIPFGGIYLPLECNPSECHRSPLLLTYDAAHFSALVPMETENEQPSHLRPAAACPLVDPDFQPLPIHFLVDPGERFVWGKDELDPKKVSNLELSSEDRMSVISRYLEVEQVLIPSAPLAVSEIEEEDGRPRCNSWSSSQPPLIRTHSVESDASNGSGSGGQKTNKDKTRMQRQMQSVAKSFGSIGRTMSKKLRKNLPRLNGRPRKPSVGSVTQSTKTAGVGPDPLKKHILSARLMHKRLSYQQEMMDNYLSAALERFTHDRELRRQQDVEMRQRAELIRRQACVTVDCPGTGTAASSYLCPSCFDQQKTEALHRASQLDPSVTTVREAQERLGKRVSPTEFQRNNTLVTSGKSRFYTYSNEQHLMEGMHPDTEQLALNNERTAQLNNAANNNSSNNRAPSKHASVVLARSSFYDEPLSVALPEQHKALVVRNNLAGDGKGKSVDEGEWWQEAAQPAQEEPPLHPAFAKHVESLNRGGGGVFLDAQLQAALKEQCSINGGLPVGGKYVAQKNMNVKGQDTNKSSYKDPQLRCVTQDCEYYGSELTDFLCSKCYREKQRTLSHLAERHTAL